MNVVPFRPEHALAIKLQPMQLEAAAEISMDYGRELAALGPAFTYMVGETVVACGGLAAVGQGIWYVWALLSLQANMLAITRAAQRMLDVYRDGIQYMAVRADFPQAQRWAEMLGFRLHTPNAADVAGVPMHVFKRVG